MNFCKLDQAENSFSPKLDDLFAFEKKPENGEYAKENLHQTVLLSEQDYKEANTFSTMPFFSSPAGQHPKKSYHPTHKDYCVTKSTTSDTNHITHLHGEEGLPEL